MTNSRDADNGPKLPLGRWCKRTTRCSCGGARGIPPAYVLAGTYAIKTLADIGLAPKSVIDKLGYRHYDRLEAQRRVQS